MKATFELNNNIVLEWHSTKPDVIDVRSGDCLLTIDQEKIASAIDQIVAIREVSGV